MGILITKPNQKQNPPAPYNGLTWFDTDEAKNKYSDIYNKYKSHFNGFFEQYKGGDKNNIYRDYLNLKWGDPLSVAQDHNIGTEFFSYQNQLFKNPQFQSDFEQMNKFNAKDTSLIPDSFNLDNWIGSLKNRAAETQDYVHSLYNTKRARRQIRRANRFAKRHGAPDRYLEFINTHDIDFNPNKNSTFCEGECDIGMNDDFPFEWKIAHEISHGRKLYNNHNPFSNKTNDSEYYGNNYNYIRKKHKRWLDPINPENTHDAELSESYSDLMGLRAALHNAGIVDGTQRRYRNKDIKKYLNTEMGQKDRYLQYHPKINRVRKALNRVYNIGGKLENE